MKLFEQLKVEEHTVEKPIVDNAAFVKANLMKGVTRSGRVYEAIESWLYSFQGAVSKSIFQAQLKRLDWNDDIAISQLQQAKGKRVIPLPPAPKQPVLQGSLIENMVEHRFVGVCGKGFKQAIREAVKQLRECGQVYVLQVEELILQFKSYEDKGSAPKMIDAAIEADFLVIVDLEMPIHLEWHIHEALTRIGRKREALKKPIISTWCRFNDCNDFFERFKIFTIR